MDHILVSVSDALQMLSIGRSTLYRLISSGKLETRKIGRRTLIKVASIKALANGAEPD